MLQSYFKALYARAINEAYAAAHGAIADALKDGGTALDCGANTGKRFALLDEKLPPGSDWYRGVEWNPDAVETARQAGLNVVRGDLNRGLDHPDGSFRCIFGLSVLEHLLNPCRYLRECHRCLEANGTLVLLTPNISTYFTAALILAGRMPSSGPHPDSDALLRHEELFKVSQDHLQPDTESDTPVHRHLVVFSYRVLQSYLRMLGFSDVRGRGFGLYPFPNFMQGLLERVDPYHCHQMIFIARK